MEINEFWPLHTDPKPRQHVQWLTPAERAERLNKDIMHELAAIVMADIRKGFGRKVYGDPDPEPGNDPEWIRVSKMVQEYFVKRWRESSPLEWNVFTAAEPMVGSYNDFSGGNVWPDSMVAKTVLYGAEKYYNFRESEHYIKRELFNL